MGQWVVGKIDLGRMRVESLRVLRFDAESRGENVVGDRGEHGFSELV